MIIPKYVQFVIDELNKNGYEAFIVGGCVRDNILNRIAKDFDITTSATPEEIKKCFRKTFDTGIAHGTITVVQDSNNIEVTTYRIDGEYSDSRHPNEVVFTKNLKDDLLRRDFTMNAIAYHEKTGFIDPFYGIDDIRKKLIKGVGDPDKRFKEDALRMLRAIRFSAQLGFDIEVDTYDALANNSYLIEKVSIERIRDELLKLLMSSNISRIIFLSQTNIIKYIYPSFYEYLLKYQNKIISYISKCDDDLVSRLVCLLQFVEINQLVIALKYFKIDLKTSKEVTVLIKNIFVTLNDDKYYIRKYINNISKDYFLKLLIIQSILSSVDNNLDYFNTIENIKKIVSLMEKNNDCLFLKDLKITGDDLIKLGIPRGKEIGKTLNFLLDIVLKDQTKNNKECLEALALSNIL